MRPQVGAKENRVIWLLLAAAFVAILNETTMGVAIPHLIGDLGITAVAAQWLTTAFMLTMAVVIPTTGFLLRRFTTRAMFATAMGLFSAGTLIALIAPGFEVLVAARVVQASGTAIMMPLLMTTLMTVVPAPARADDGPCQRGDLAGPAIGPTMAGIVLDNLTWRWIFAIVLPIALVALVVGVRWIHNLGEARTRRSTSSPCSCPPSGSAGWSSGSARSVGTGRMSPPRRRRPRLSSSRWASDSSPSDCSSGVR
jgi:DHA2 family lincomycin resistance protein-like MFS transporter